MLKPNIQPIETQRSQARVPIDHKWDIVSVWKTIQGEGPFAGTVAVFIRLAGCNLQCPLCDTNYTKGRRPVSASEIAELVAIESMRGRAMGEVEVDLARPRLIVLTGGEPFRQDVFSLIFALDSMFRSADWGSVKFQIESNGTLAPLSVVPAHCDLTVVISPKTPKINPFWFTAIEADSCRIWYKYVLDADAIDPADGLPTSVLGNGLKPYRPPQGWSRSRIFVQPVDVNDEAENKRHARATAVVAMQYGYRLTLQQHKLVGLP